MKFVNSFLALFISVNLLAQETEVTRGPYLQSGYTDKVTVCLRTTDKVKPTVYYGTERDALDKTSEAIKEGKDHFIDVSGLEPYTKYYYEIKVGDEVLIDDADDLYFRTHPASDKDIKTHGWVLGDCGSRATAFVACS